MPDQDIEHDPARRVRLDVLPGMAQTEPEDEPRRALPTPLTSFVGREQQSAEVRRLLASCRLLTLTGFGGIGKTRLALEVASGAIGAYPDGVHVVELASLADPDLVPRTVAGALGLEEVAGRSPIEIMQAQLARQRLLLVLDNCEHLLDACAELADRLLRTCPGVQILATSQEALGIDGETVWQVPPLDLPTDWLPLLDAAHVGAVRLFVERAQARLPDFVLSDASLPAVVEICRRLDGIPLAIELAAAWLPMLTADELAARLSDRFRLLTGGSRMALPRHRTLRALVDWSYGRLSDDERRLMARLSVFAGGWTLDAAEAIEGFGCWVSGFGGRGPAPETLAVLASLVAKSLVVTTAGGGTTRYRFLETIRQYTAEQLTGDELIETHRRHATYFARLAERADPRLRGEEQRAWLERLDADHDNLRAALRWSIDAGEAEISLRLCGGLRVYWWIRANLHESAQWLEQALSTGGQTSEIARARALNGAGDLARIRGQYTQATAFHTAALELARQVGDQRETAIAIHFLASLAEVRGDFAEAERLYLQDLALFEGLGDNLGAARALNNLGSVARGQGDYAHAVALLEKSLTISRAHGDLWTISASLDELARVARAQRDVQRTSDLCLESLALFHVLGVKRHIALGLDLAAWVSAARGQHVRAARLYAAAAALREAVGSATLPNEQRIVSRDLAALRSALGPARFAEAWARGRATSPDDAVAYALAPEPADPAAAQAATLTRREREVVERISRGLSNREIAAELVISLLTVESHVRNVLRKLGLERRGQVAVWAVQHQLGVAAPPNPDAPGHAEHEPPTGAGRAG